MITHIKGNLLDFPNGITVIGHGCNTQGKMKSGIAKSIVEKWPKVAEADLYMFKHYNSLLGRVGLVLVNEEEAKETRTVANLYQQSTTRTSHPDKKVHLKYSALVSALTTLRDIYLGTGTHFGFPKFMGCGLAGGDWHVVETLIDEIFENEQVTIVEYIP